MNWTLNVLNFKEGIAITNWLLYTSINIKYHLKNYDNGSIIEDSFLVQNSGRS